MRVDPTPALSTRNGSLIAVACLSFAASAQAWQVEGYRSGMTVEEVIGVLASRGLTPDERVKRDSRYAVEFSTMPFTKYSPTFFFCKGRLHFYKRYLDPAAEFVPLVDSLRKQYGQPELRTNPWPNHPEGIDLTLGFKNKKGDEMVSVTLLQDSLPTVSIRWAEVNSNKHPPCKIEKTKFEHPPGEG